MGCDSSKVWFKCKLLHLLVIMFHKLMLDAAASNFQGCLNMSEFLQVGTVRKPKPPVLAAAISAWTFLLTTIGSWRINPNSWKESVLSSVLHLRMCAH